jgi:hypothetical protein
MAIAVSPGEIEAVRTVMRDLQIGAARYYAATGSADDLGSTVRAFIADCQTLNDWFLNAIADSASYKALFREPRHPGVDVIDAMKYVRNVSQHVLHVVKPSDTQVLVGGTLGYRVYANWESIPADVHEKLHRGTRALRPAYEANLDGKELMSTMMAVLRFYAGIAPTIVHRDQHGEWTGFPLMNQPGIPDPLHPEEPIRNSVKARAWMDSRRPGGEARVVCGQVTINEVKYVYGHTFVGRLSFAPFSETIPQVNRDIALGFPYFDGDLTASASDVSTEYLDAPQSSVIRSRGDLATWTTPVSHVAQNDDWCSPGFDADSWFSVCRLEVAGPVPDFMAHEVRRARRLNAFVPPRFR